MQRNVQTAPKRVPLGQSKTFEPSKCQRIKRKEVFLKALNVIARASCGTAHSYFEHS